MKFSDILYRQSVAKSKRRKTENDHSDNKKESTIGTHCSNAHT